MIYLVPDQIEGLCSDQQASCHRTILLHETSAICLTTVSLMRIAGFCFPKAQGEKSSESLQKWNDQHIPTFPVNGPLLNTVERLYKLHEVNFFLCTKCTSVYFCLSNEAKKLHWMKIVFLHGFFSDNAQGRLFATHTKCVEGVLGEWADQVLYIWQPYHC